MVIRSNNSRTAFFALVGLTACLLVSKPNAVAANDRVGDFPVVFEQASLRDSLKRVLVRNAKKLILWSRDAGIIEAVTAANGSLMPIEAVLQRDAAWQNNQSEAGFEDSFSENVCAEILRGLMSRNTGFFEAFVMDKQGGIVCLTSRTSDYWQGDETKWQIPFKQRSVNIGALEFDASAERPLVQISLPILGKSDDVIGVITIGKTVNIHPGALKKK